MPRTDKKQTATRLDDARARMYHDLIFESGECVFGAKGFDGATMHDIAHEAGVSLKTVYQSYAGKQELFEEIMRVRGGAFRECVQAAMKAATGPMEGLEGATRAFVSFLFEHRDWLSIHLRSRIAWSIRPSDEAAADLWKKGLGDLETLLSEGMREGVFYAADAAELAVLANTLMKVQVTYAADGGDADADAVADRVLVHLRRLLCVPERVARNVA